MAIGAKSHLLPTQDNSDYQAFCAVRGSLCHSGLMKLVTLTHPVAAALLTAVVIAGCGAKASSDVKAPSYAELKSGLAGSSPRLALVHSEMGKVLTTGKVGFSKVLAGLKGYPVVVNVWASWCGPCRMEFPVLGQASLKYGKTVGFIGVSNRDTVPSAQKFLTTHPVGYPSFDDPNGAISTTLGIANGLPATIIFNTSGAKGYVHQGPYETVEALATDIERYGH